MDSMKLYEHDCKVCKYLGSFNKHDLYVCPQGVKNGGIPTLIARSSSRGEDYWSGITFARSIPELGKALELVLQRGLLVDSGKQDEFGRTIYNYNFDAI